MKDFVSKNKIAVILFLIFVGLTIVSGFYLPSNLKNYDAPKLIDQPKLSSSLTTASSSPLAIDALQPINKQPDIVTTTAEVPTPVNQISTPTTTAVVPEVKGENYTLIVGDKQYQISLPGQPTAYDLMLALKRRGDFDFQGKGSAGLGWFVEAINGVKNNSFKNIFWFFYVNGQSSNVGISSYVLKPNDVISWKYEKSKF